MLVVSNGVCSDTLTKTIIVRNGRFEVVEQPKNLPELLDIVSANLFPNPFKGRVALDLALTTEAEVWISIFSINGNIIDEKRKVTMEDRFEFDLTRESDGVYLMKVVVKNRVKVFKLVKTGGY